MSCSEVLAICHQRTRKRIQFAIIDVKPTVTISFFKTSRHSKVKQKTIGGFRGTTWKVLEARHPSVQRTITTTLQNLEMK